jgi:hypothetical protein
MDKKLSFYGHRLNKKQSGILDEIIKNMFDMKHQLEIDGEDADLGDNTGNLMEQADDLMVALGVYDKKIL